MYNNGRLIVLLSVLVSAGIFQGLVLPAARASVAKKNAQFCVPGESYLDDDRCNTCMCNGDGTGPESCTRLECDGVAKRIKREYCVPEEFFITSDKCYLCLCDSAGKSGLCTPMICGRSPANFDVGR